MTDEQVTAAPGPTPGNTQRERRPDRQNWPALIARFPRLFWHPAEDGAWDNDWPVVPPQSLEDYPWLSDRPEGMARSAGAPVPSA